MMGDVWGGGVYVPSVATMTYIGTHAVKKEDKEKKKLCERVGPFLEPSSIL